MCIYIFKEKIYAIHILPNFKVLDFFVNIQETVHK